ncbi:equilibrative nucleoside transporter 4 isoform X1 [Pezoporus wallicus]|uniref:equilibrative nucleoside transporter 4 isoform X1 n=2 Tax=Pezoporus wallicus TaxID=35540 RepID=UPI00254B1154|nr:equilibrative nucleoside transporter 4 isoform X1 [Pezoporus wallicus]
MPQSRRGGARLPMMGSVGSERLKELSPAGTPEGNVVMSFSFDSYQLEEDELQRGSQAKGVLTFMEPVSEDPEPQDRYHGIYFAMLLAGVGFLLPYNSFITDVDYLHHKYPGTSIVFDMSLTYILVALVAVILNNALVELLSLHTRISVGYLFALGPLLFVSICDVWLELFSRRQAYAINLVAVGVVAFGCTVQQSSFYGYTGLLPKRYTQGVMTGESTAGVIISLSRIFTKLLLSDEKENTVIFFFISIGMELTCFILHLLVKRTRFVRYYTSCSRKGLPEARGAGDHGTGYRVHHDVTAEDIRFVSQQWAPPLAPGVPSELSTGVPSPPIQENRQWGQPSPPRGSPGHEAELAGSGTYMRFDVPQPKIKRSWPSFRDMLLYRYVVSRLIWAYMLSIAMTYFITLCLFPGLESEIHNCTLGEWLPILIMAIFNLSDFVGKILAALPYDWRGTHLLVYSCLRVVFIPLFIMCVYPNGKPTFGHPAWPCIFSLLMGITNGYFGSVPMILAAGKVSPEQRELAGNTMTVSYMTGLTLGSAVAYFAYSLTSTSHSSCFYTETSNSSFTLGY